MSNLFDSVVILYVNQQLIQEFFEPDKVYIYHKSYRFYGGLAVMVFGNGIIMAEGT